MFLHDYPLAADMMRENPMFDYNTSLAATENNALTVACVSELPENFSRIVFFCTKSEVDVCVRYKRVLGRYCSVLHCYGVGLV